LIEITLYYLCLYGGSDKDNVPTIFDKNSILTIHYYVRDTWDRVTGYEKTSYSKLEDDELEKIREKRLMELAEKLRIRH